MANLTPNFGICPHTIQYVWSVSSQMSPNYYFYGDKRKTLHLITLSQNWVAAFPLKGMVGEICARAFIGCRALKLSSVCLSPFQAFCIRSMSLWPTFSKHTTKLGFQSWILCISGSTGSLLRHNSRDSGHLIAPVKRGRQVNIFLISPQKKNALWYSLEVPLRGSSNNYPQCMFL